MKKIFLKMFVIVLLAVQMLWINLLFPVQKVEARTGQPAALASQTILKAAQLNLQGPGKSLFTASNLRAVELDSISLLKIQTIPPAAGVHFTLGTLSFVSGPDGIAALPLNNGQNYSLQVDPVPANTDTTQYEFNRWSDGTPTDQRDIRITGDQVIQVGLDVYNKVGMTFQDSSRKPVDPGRVTLITIQSAQGDAYSFPDGQPHWLLASGINRQADKLQPASVQYTLTSVLVDGSNVVDESQQVFYAHPGDIWPLKLGLYSVHITARDALYHNPIGSGVALEYPNGLLKTIPFSANKDVTISSLAEGNYHVQVTGVSGIASYTPIALSQDQEIDLTLPTQLDIVTAFAAGILFALGILFVGRLRQRSRRTAQELDQTAGEFQGTHYNFK